ncbi:MAG: SDR family NAD(P)-dependent oxidoreductase [Bdellovibrionales bacterium]|nr:SDR family NAD(P)-dependent oxidoreductase [Bdellovibrionales bacterium]
MNLYIITGTTKGLGHALSKIALENQHMVLSLSRKKTILHDNFHHLNCDLSKTALIEKKITSYISKLNLKKIKSIHLINNAAMISPIGSLSDFSLSDIQAHINTIMLSPMILTSVVLRIFKRKKVPKTITFISSGAGLRPIANWSLYCSAKSGLRMFAECLEAEYEKDLFVKFLDFSPGVMDTDMQKTIRSQSSASFGRVSDFIELKEKNLLLSSQEVASTLMDLLKDPSNLDKTHYDIKDFIKK